MRHLFAWGLAVFCFGFCGAPFFDDPKRLNLKFLMAVVVRQSVSILAQEILPKHQVGSTHS